MGNNYCCLPIKTSHEFLIDEMLSIIPLRQIPLDSLLKIINENITESQHSKHIPDTNFQKIYNDYGVFPDKFEAYHKFWSTVLAYITKKKTLCLLFIICMLSKFEVNQDTINKFHELFLRFFEFNTKTLLVLGSELHDIISKYISTITYLTIEPFKVYSNDPKEFTTFLKVSWHPDKIHNFVSKYFFKELKTLSVQIDIIVFLKKYLYYLSDEVQLRRDLTTYIQKNQDVY